MFYINKHSWQHLAKKKIGLGDCVKKNLSRWRQLFQGDFAYTYKISVSVMHVLCSSRQANELKEKFVRLEVDIDTY